MPARSKRTVTGGQKVQKPEIIILCLPLVCLGLLLAVVSLNNKPVSGKPAAVAAAPTPVPTVALTSTASPTTGSPALPTPTLTATGTTPAAASIPATSIPAATGPVQATATASPGNPGASLTVKAGSPEGSGIRLTDTKDGLKFDLLVSPGHIGNNNYLLLLSENGNQAVTDASLVRLSVTSLDMDMGVANLDLQPAGADQPGLYTGIDNKLQMLSMVGKFNLAVLVQRPGHSDVTTSFQLSVKGS